MPVIGGPGGRALGGLTVLVFVVAAAAPVALAGTVFEMKTVYFDENKPPENATIYLDENRLRFDAIEDGKIVALIVRLDEAGDPFCWVIDTSEKTYVEVTRETAQQIKTQVEQSKKMAEEQMKNMPPQQRGQVKRMMETQFGKIGQKLEVEFKEIASGVKVNGWMCTQLESYVEGDKHEDIWAADWKQIGLEPSDVEIFGELASLFEGVSPQTNAFFQMGKSKSGGGFEGFPIVVVEYKDGEKHEKSEVTSIRKESLKSDLFELPEGFTKKGILDR